MLVPFISRLAARMREGTDVPSCDGEVVLSVSLAQKQLGYFKLVSACVGSYICDV